MTKILIAEDEEFIASLYKLELERHGAEVKIVVNGQEALEAIAQEHFDALLLDLMMPVVDGFEVLEQLKAKSINLPTLVLTNLSQVADQEKCAELGAKDYVIKADTDAPEVWAHVQKLLPA